MITKAFRVRIQCAPNLISLYTCYLHVTNYISSVHHTPHTLVSSYVRLLFYNTKFNTPNTIISEKWWKLFKRKNPSSDAIWLKWLFILVWHHLIHFWNVLTAHCCRINISLVKINFLMNDRYGGGKNSKPKRNTVLPAQHWLNE